MNKTATQPANGVDAWFGIDAYVTREDFEQANSTVVVDEGFPTREAAVEFASSGAMQDNYEVVVCAYGAHADYKPGEQVWSRFARALGAAEDSSGAPRKFHVAAQNDAFYIISGEAPSSPDDEPRHDADRTCIAKVFDEAEARRLVDAANRALAGA